MRYAVLIGLIGAPYLLGQRFDVASIHACGPNTVVPLREAGGLGATGASPNRVIRNCYTVMQLIQDAYVIFADGKRDSPASVQMPQIEKAPGWISSDLFTVEATAEGAPGQAAMLGPMMQALLEERFHLKLHREARNGPAYEVTVAKGGSKLKANRGSCSVDVPPGAAPPGFATGKVSPPLEAGQPCRLKLNLNHGPNQLFVASAITMEDFCSYLSHVTKRTVIDGTGVAGKFDIRVEFLRDQIAAQEPSEQSEAGVTLFAALEQQLGLKLTSVKGAREVIVIDHVERPSKN